MLNFFKAVIFDYLAIILALMLTCVFIGIFGFLLPEDFLFPCTVFAFIFSCWFCDKMVDKLR